MADDANEAFFDAFDEGSFELCEIERAGNDEFFAWVEKYAASAATSIEELQRRIQAAADAPDPILARWEEQERKAQEEADRRDPQGATR